MTAAVSESIALRWHDCGNAFRRQNQVRRFPWLSNHAMLLPWSDMVTLLIMVRSDAVGK
jgi:hypothetical protein